MIPITVVRNKKNNQILMTVNKKNKFIANHLVAINSENYELVTLGVDD